MKGRCPICKLFKSVWKSNYHMRIKSFAIRMVTCCYKELIVMPTKRDRLFLERSTGDRYEVTIAKTQHGHFSDFLVDGAGPAILQFDGNNPSEI